MCGHPHSGPWRSLVIVAVVGLAAWVLYRETIVGPVVLPLQVLTARVTLASVHLLGLEGARLGTVVYHPEGFGYEISHGCTGLVPVVLLATGIIAYRASVARKIVGVLVGAPALLLLNLVRLVHLYTVGVRRPDWFAPLHEWVWGLVVVLAAVGLWLAWLIWVDRDLSHDAERVLLENRGDRDEIRVLTADAGRTAPVGATDPSEPPRLETSRPFDRASFNAAANGPERSKERRGGKYRRSMLRPYTGNAHPRQAGDAGDAGARHDPRTLS